MCGKEISGYESSEAGLYRNAVFVLTPLDATSSQALALAQSLAPALGARPLVLEGERHDRIVAAISHLPFTLAVRARWQPRDELAQTDERCIPWPPAAFATRRAWPPATRR